MQNPLYTEGPISVYLCKKQHIKDAVTNWSKNRPADPTRVIAITEHNEKLDKRSVDGMVFAWKKSNKLIIYDGWTRYSAANDDMFLFLSVFDTSYELDIVQHFYALNSAVPVPTLYIREPGTDSPDETKTKNEKASQIVAACNSFCKTYKSFLSASRRPQKPNFNRDIFTEQLDAITSDDVDAETIIKCLYHANKKMADQHSNFPEKCNKGGLYLFGDKSLQWQTFFVKALQQSKEQNRSWIQRIKSVL